MTLLTPESLIWIAFAVPVVLLYLWNPRTPKRHVATGFLWQRILDPMSSIGRALRWPISLAVHLGLLTLLVVALSEPLLNTPCRTVLILDRSTSMKATDGRSTRWDEAKRLALEQLDSQGSNDRTALISIGERVRVHTSFVREQETIRHAIDQIPAPGGETHISQAIDFARRLLAETPDGRIVVISDGCFDQTTHPDDMKDVTWIAVGTPVDNLAITRLAARRNVSEPLGAQVVVEVANFASQSTECRLDLTLDDRAIEAIPLQLSAGERWRRVFAFSTKSGGRLTASIDCEEPLVDDNRAETILPTAPLRHVTLVTDKGLSLRKVLESNPRVSLTVTDRIPSRIEQDTILLLDSQATNTLPSGPVLVIHPTTDTELWQSGEPLDEPTVMRQSTDSPLLHHVRLEGLRWDGAMGVSLTERAGKRARPFVWATDERALGYAIDRPEGRLIVLSVDPETSDLRHVTAFPILMANALDWLVGEEPSGAIAFSDSNASEIDLIAPTAWTARNQPQPPDRVWPAVWMVLSCVAWVGILLEWYCFQRRWTV